MYYLKRLTVTDTKPLHIRAILLSTLMHSRARTQLIEQLPAFFSNGQVDFDLTFDDFLQLEMLDAPDKLSISCQENVSVEVYWRKQVY